MKLATIRQNCGSDSTFSTTRNPRGDVGAASEEEKEEYAALSIDFRYSEQNITKKAFAARRVR